MQAFVDVVQGGNVQERVRNAVPASFGRVLAVEKSTTYRLVRGEPADGCTTVQKLENDTAVLLDRGSCTFVEKAINVQNAGGGLVVVVNNQTQAFQMGCAGGTEPDQGGAVKIPAVMIDAGNGHMLVELVEQQGESQVDVAVYRPKVPVLDLSAVVLLLLAVCTIAAGTWWTVCDDHAGITLLSMHGEVASDGQEEHENFALLLTEWNAVMFVLVASSVLLVLFLFMSDLFMILLILIFALAAFQSLLYFTQPLIESVFPSFRAEKVEYPFFGENPRSSVIGIPLNLAIVVVWVVFRHSNWSWMLQDLMGVSLMVFILRQFRLPNLRVASVLLPLAFIYDVWWVFIQPRVFHDQSVMVSVATGASLREEIPMLLKVPHIMNPLGGYALLGYGDVILPGLLVVLNMHIDLRLDYWEGKTGRVLGGYYYPSLMGYVVGLMLTYIALIFNVGGQNGQPALLYLVPCTLGTTVVLALVRGEFFKLWDWKIGRSEEEEKDEESGPGINMEQHSPLVPLSGTE